MLDILKLLLPLFLSRKNYNEMLKKLGAFLFWETWIVTFLLRGIQSIDEMFHSMENYGRVGAALSIIPNYEKLNLGGFFIALIVACVSCAIQIHDRIFDLLHIRRRFDRNYILLALAILVGPKLNPQQLISLAANRDSVTGTHQAARINHS